jgi:hypothetical protein
MAEIKRLEVTVHPATSLGSEISDRLSQDLVIALVGPFGSGVSTSA